MELFGKFEINFPLLLVMVALHSESKVLIVCCCICTGICCITALMTGNLGINVPIMALENNLSVLEIIWEISALCCGWMAVVQRHSKSKVLMSVYVGYAP